MVGSWLWERYIWVWAQLKQPLSLTRKCVGNVSTKNKEYVGNAPNINPYPFEWFSYGAQWGVRVLYTYRSEQLLQLVYIFIEHL